jgi:hypothetical protein
MKISIKILLCSITVVLILGFISIAYSWYSESKGKYPLGGRDTEAAFGNGRYVILQSYEVPEEVKNGTEKFDPKKSKRISILFDREGKSKGIEPVENPDVIEDEIYKYYETKPYVYVIGKNGYTKLNYTKCEFKQTKSISDFQDSDILVFNNNSKFKLLVKN